MRKLLVALPFVFLGFGCPGEDNKGDPDMALCGGEICGSGELCCAISCGPSAGAPMCVTASGSCPVASCDLGHD